MSGKIFILILLMCFFSALSGCKDSSGGNNLENGDNDIDMSESEDDSDNEKGDLEQDLENNDQTPVEADNDILPDKESHDEETYISPCNPNPCKEENKTICREIDDYGYYPNSDMEFFCTCDEGWMGSKCDKCQTGYFGADCKPCQCGHNEKCSDGLSGNGECSCIQETLPDGTCPCLSGWSGKNCEIFGANWKCAQVGQLCSTTGDCCYDAVCMVSLLDGEKVCRKKKRYGNEEIRKLDISKDGRLIATGRMGAIRIHCAETLKELFRLPDDIFGSTAIAFSPDGSFLALDEKGLLVLRSMNDGSILDKKHGSLSSLEFSPDSTMLAAVQNGETRVYNIVENRLEESFSFEEDASSISFSPNGLMLAVGSGSLFQGENVHMYSIKEKKLIKTISVNEYYLKVAFSPDSRMLAVGGYDYDYKPPVNIFNVNNSWNLNRNVYAYFQEVHSLSFHNSTEYLAIGGRGAGVVYSLKENFFPLVPIGWQQNFSSNGKFLISGGEEGFLIRYSVPMFEIEANTLEKDYRFLSLSADGTSQILASYPSSIIFTEAITSEPIKKIQTSETIWNYLYFKESNNGQHGCFHKSYRDSEGFLIVDLNDGKTFFKNAEISAEAFSFSPDNKVFAVFDQNSSKTLVYSIKTFEKLFSINHEEDTTASDIQFSPDGATIVITTNSKNIVYDRIDGAEKFTIPGIGSPTFLPDGTKIAVANGIIRIYSTVDGSEESDPLIEKSGKMVKFSGDGKYMITDNGIHEIETGFFSGFTKHYYGIKAIGISSGNDVVVTTGKDTTRVIDMSGVITPYESGCRKDSDCKEGNFCNSRLRRCFPDIPFI